MKKFNLFILFSSILLLSACSNTIKEDTKLDLTINESVVDEKVEKELNDEENIIEIVDEKYYNDLTTLVYKDTRIDLSNCSLVEWDKFKQQFGLASSTYTGTLNPYETSWGIYNPYDKEIGKSQARMVSITLTEDDIAKFPDDCYFLNGLISVRSGRDEVRDSFIEFTGDKYLSEIALENGQLVTIEFTGNSDIYEVSFELTPFYE